MSEGSVREVTAQWTSKFRSNTDVTLRDLIGSAIRRLADSIDGRRSVAIEMISIPALSTHEQCDVIRQGLKRMKEIQVEMVRLRTVDALANELMPSLDGEQPR
jgi:hypothetical protein